MKAKNIILSILDENAVHAKNLINEDLTVKLGQRLALLSSWLLSSI